MKQNDNLNKEDVKMTNQEAIEILKKKETKEIIYSNYPQKEHVLLASAVDLAIKLLEKDIK